MTRRLQSGPSGENPTGQVTLADLDPSVTCLAVHTLATNPPVASATMNLQTSGGGLVTLQVDDGNPEGIPDFISAISASTRSPSDCSPLSLSSANLKGFVLSGDIDIVDAPPAPASREQCKDGGWRGFPAFKNQGQCVAFVEREPKHR